MAVRTKMSRADRAKQFMPFDALTGYREALRQKERAVTAQNNQFIEGDTVAEHEGIAERESEEKVDFYSAHDIYFYE